MLQARFTKTLLGAAITLASLALAGCGGGGSSSSLASTGTSSSTGASTGASAYTMQITSTNAQQLASTVFSGSSLSSLGSQVQSLEAVSPTQAPNALSEVAKLAAQAVQHYGAGPNSAMPAQALAAASASSNCTGGGTLTLTANEANPNVGLQPGDSLQIQASSCTQSSGGYSETMNGALTATVDSYGSTAAGSQSAIAIAASNFTVSDTLGNSEALNGSMTGAVALTTSPDQTSRVELTSPGFTMAETSGGVQSSLDLQSLDYWVYDDLTTGAWQFSENAAMNDNGQTFSVATTTPFSGSGCAYPSSGTATLNGAGSSAVEVTALSNGQTQLQVGSGGTVSDQTVASSQVFSMYCY
jgi:hypothetical protein